MIRSTTSRCRAKVKDACPFHGNAFHDSSDRRIKQYLSDVAEYKLPRNLSVLATDWQDRPTHAFASAVVANAQPNLHNAVKAQMLDFIGDDQRDMAMLELTTAMYNRYLRATERIFYARKQTELAKTTDEQAKIAALSTYLSSQILSAKAEADKLRAEINNQKYGVPQEDRRVRFGAAESDMLANEALAYRLTEVRNGLDKQFKRTAKRAAPPAIPDWNWFSTASRAELEKAAITPAREPVDWLGGEQVGSDKNVWTF